MAYTYAQRKRPQGRAEPAAEHAAPGPDMNSLIAGTARPSAAQKGRPIELNAAIKAKMENAFGDLSAVKLYESPTVGAAGAEAMAQGSEIAFAPGLADFSTREGQARLGHELSHVAARRSGAAPQSSGFLNDRSLEQRADREGAMAAAGQQVYAGPVTGALSGASPSAAAAGPMQAKRNDGKEKAAKKPAKKAAKKPAKKPQKKKPVKLSYRDMEETKAFDDETDELKLYGGETDDLYRKDDVFRTDDEDADWVSPELMREFQSRNNRKADKLFYVGAGVLADDEADTNAYNDAIDSVLEQYNQEEMQKWNNPEIARSEAYDRAIVYANKNKAKIKKTVSAKDKAWFDQETSDPSLDLYRALHSRKQQAARELIAYRENIGKLKSGENEDKLDYESSYSEAARKMNIYDMILSSMAMTPAAMKFQKELEAQGKERDDPEVKTKSDKLSTAGKTGKFAKTEEGKAHAPMFRDLQIEALKGTYLSRPGAGKKKKK